MKDCEFGKRLKLIRDLKGITQREAAELLQLKIRAIQSNEAGQWPNRNNLSKYLEFYKCDKAWLMTGAGEPYIKEGFEVGVAVAGGGGEVASPKPVYDWTPQMQGEDWELVGKAHKVLSSDTIYRAALASNINAFHHAIETEARANRTEALLKAQSEEIKKLKEGHEALKTRFVDFEAHIKEEGDAKDQTEDTKPRDADKAEGNG